MWKDVIQLGQMVETIEYGEVVKSFTYRKVFANRLKSRENAYWQANTIGKKPELAFEIRSVEYDDTERVMYKGIEYEIVGTLDKGETMELAVSRGVEDGS